ncbi:MAG: hypothetical protein ACKO9Q_07235 [Pirellula sp.]
MKKSLNWLFFLGVLSLGTISGCRQESREYLLALEAKDRLIESSHKARRDSIEALGHRNLARADRAMGDEFKIEEQGIYVEGTLDRYRPHKPNKQLFEHATRVLDELRAKRKELTDQWVEVFGKSQADDALELSSKIRDVELAIAETTEVAKRSKPSGASSSSAVILQNDPAGD